MVKNKIKNGRQEMVFDKNKPVVTRTSNFANIKLFVSAVMLLAVALGFNALFNFMTLDRLSTEAIAFKYQIVGDDLKRRIEGSLVAGWPIQTTKNITEGVARAQQLIAEIPLEGIQQNDDNITAVESEAVFAVYKPDGKMLWSSLEPQSPHTAPILLENPLREGKEKRSVIGNTRVITQDGRCFLQFPLQPSLNHWAGSLVISFSKNEPSGKKNDGIKKQFFLGFLLLTGSILLLVLLNFILKQQRPNEQFPKKKVTIVLFFVISPVLVIFSSLNTFTASKQYFDITRQKTEITLTLTKKNIEFLMEQGMTIDDAVRTDTMFLEMLKPYPILDSIIVLNSKDNWIFAARQENTKKLSGMYHGWSDALFERSSYLSTPHRAEIFKNLDTPASGSVEIRISKDHFLREAVNIVLNAVTAAAISILFLVEILIFVFHFIDKPLFRGKTVQPVHFGLIRPVTFLFLFGIDISISFIPLHMEKIYTPIFGLSRDAIMGLPISVEFLFVGIAIFFCGFWNDRRGWHEPFLSGLFLAGTGVLYSWAAPNVVHFIISRAIVGIGYGLTLLAAQGFVIAFSDEQTKARAFAQFISGIYAGSICGGATGALLAEKLGYGWVFFIGAMILYSIIFYSMVFMRRAMVRPEIPPVSKGESQSYKLIFSMFLKNRIVLSLIFLSSLPASIAAVGFLNYFSPIYLNRIGASQATIGRVLMVYGFSLVYLGPIVGKFVDKDQNKKKYVFIGCVLGSISFLMFYFLDGLFAATVAVLLLGLSNSYIIASQSTYLLMLKVPLALGPGKAIGIFRASSRIGQSLGPIVFSGLIMSENIRSSITKFGLFYLLTALLFIVFTQKDKDQYKRY